MGAITGMELKEQKCAGLSSACCKSLQALGTIDMKKITEPDTIKKMKALGEDAEKTCSDADDGKALKECKTAGTMKMLVEPQQVMLGFGGFLAGAAVVGLATGLKRRSQVALEEP